MVMLSLFFAPKPGRYLETLSLKLISCSSTNFIIHKVVEKTLVKEAKS